jgi:hypothetical protein
VTFNFEEDTTLTFVPATPPKVTFGMPANPLPVTVTRVPPAGGPASGDTDDTTGTGTGA